MARGYERTRSLSSVVEGKSVIWQERLLIVQSYKLAQAGTQTLRHKLQQAQEALASLQPSLGQRGKKRYREVVTLPAAAAAIVTKWQVDGLLQVRVDSSQGINLTTFSGIGTTNETQHHIPAFSELQECILALLKMPLNLYSRLNLVLDELPPKMNEP